MLTFTKIDNGNVIVETPDSTLSIPPVATLLLQGSSILIRWGNGNRLLVYHPQVSAPVTADIGELFSVLSTSFFFQSITNLDSYIFKVVYYEEITTTSGTLTKPTGSTILLNQWSGGVDALISPIVDGKPTFEDSGVDVTSFGTDGSYACSASLPTNPAAIIFQLSIPLSAYGNLDIEHIVEYAEFAMSMPFKGTTNDGSTNIIEGENSDGLMVFKVDTNGFELDQFDDLLPSAQWQATSGGAAPDLVAYSIGGINASFWTFDGGNTTEQMTNSFEITHGIDIDALNADTIVAEVHTHGFPTTTGSGVVRILIDIIYQKVNSAPVAYTPLYINMTINANEQYWHKLGGVEIPKPAAGYGIGDHVIVRYSRVPSDPIDTYTGDWAFMQCALHMPFNSRGSRQRYVK